MTANELKKEIRNWLLVEIRIPKEKIRIEKQLIPQYKWSPKPDIDLPLDKETRIFIEIEDTQSHPESNVLKYWWWMEFEEAGTREARRQLKKVVLIQVFGKQFRGENLKLKIDLCKFIATRMANNLPCIFHYHDFKGQLENAFSKIRLILNVYLEKRIEEDYYG